MLVHVLFTYRILFLALVFFWGTFSGTSIILGHPSSLYTTAVRPSANSTVVPRGETDASLIPPPEMKTIAYAVLLFSLFPPYASRCGKRRRTFISRQGTSIDNVLQSLEIFGHLIVCIWD